MNPFKKILVPKAGGIAMEMRIDSIATGIPMKVCYEPTPENARLLLKDYFADWEFREIHHDKEALQLAYTSPEGAKKIYGEHW